MTTLQFWIGFIAGAAVNAAFVIAFTKWQEWKDAKGIPRV